MPAIRIGVNALYLIPGGVGGTEIYLRSLLRGLAEVDRENEYFVFTNLETASDILPEQDNFRLTQLNVRASFRPGRILAEQTVLPSAARRLRLNVLLNPGFTSPFVTPCPSVTVFHDLQHKRHPEFFRWFDLPFWRALLYASAHRSARLIAVSQATHDDLLRFYALDRRKIHVVQHGVDPAFFALGAERSASRLSPLLLCVSTLHPHKNLERLVRVFARFREARPGYTLVIAGLRGFHAQALERQIASLMLDRYVTLTGWIPREDLYEHFRRASAFVYPSTFEGFGMPVLEALAAGIPTACSSAEPIPSAGGGAAIYFDPYDDEAMLASLLRLTSDAELRAQLTSAGPARAGQFSWRKAAEETLAILREAAR